MKRKSERMILIEKCEDLLRDILKIERGDRCEVCGRTPTNLGLFHILVKARYPNMRLNRYNVLLTCYMPCHYFFHHDFSDPRAKRTIDKIIELRGADYENKLKAIDKFQASMTMFQLNLYHKAFKQELESRGHPPRQ